MSRRAVGQAAALAALGLWLRLYGFGWGLPDPRHHFSYHPDEYNVLRALGPMQPAGLDFNPRYFHNPALYYYLCGTAYAAGRLGGFMPPLDGRAFHQRPEDVARFFRLGRALSALFGALTVAVVYLAAAPLGTLPAVAAGLVVALSPGHVVLSHYMDVDALLTLLAALCLWAAARAATSDSRRATAAAGVLAGLAMATKYTGVLLLLSALAGAALRPPAARRMGRVLALAALAYLAGAPYTLLDWPGFTEGLRYVLEERVAGRWSGLGHGPLFPLLATWPWLIGGAGLVLALAGLLVQLGRETRTALPAALLVGATYASAALSGTDYLRYSVAALPGLALGVAWLLAATRNRLARVLLAGGLTAGLGEQAARGLALLDLLRPPDVRDQADRFLRQRYPAGARLLVPREPYFYSPPVIFQDYFYQGRSTAWRAPSGTFRVDSAGWNPAALASLPLPSAIVVSEHELLYPAVAGSGTGRFLTALLSSGRYREVARFDRPARLGPLLLEAPLPPAGWVYDPAEAGAIRDARLPHDLKYLNPALLVLEPVAGEEGPGQP